MTATAEQWAEALHDVADELERANRSLPSYYREMLLRGHPAYLSAHHRDSYLMERLARERRYAIGQSSKRRHFYLAFQGMQASEIQDAAARGW